MKHQQIPISFLKSNNYECGICFSSCLKPLRCLGKCGKTYCIKCISHTRLVKNACPFKCSSPFLVEAIPDIALDFFCPFSPKCTVPINSLKLFKDHYQICLFVSPEELFQKKLQQEYKCPKGHQLQFFIGTYAEMIKSKCAICENDQPCRSICRVCERLFCIDCRVPPCSKMGCPLGHSYNYQKITSCQYSCDMCGINMVVSNRGVYDDQLCNFGICEACYADLPDFPENFDPSQQPLISNTNTKCSCGNNLEHKSSVHKLIPCAICTKNKQCAKHCPVCQKFYCLDCKLMDVQRSETCILDHKFQTVELDKLPLEVREQNEYGCMRCMKICEKYKMDSICKVRLCNGCFRYCKSVTEDKTRCVMLLCDQKHVLSYISGISDHYYPCAQCKASKIVKLKCRMCSVKGMKCYCLKCRPIKLDTCYCKHPLKLGKFSGQRQCHLCHEKFDEFYWCKKCYFYVCKGCIDSNKAQFEQESSLEKQLPEKNGLVNNN